MPDALPGFLASYLEQRQVARAEAVAAFLAKLTDRESALFQDAAVMGYVRGSLYPRGEEIPLNAEILAEVVDACFVYPDLYPAVDAVANPGDRTFRAQVEFFGQCQQPDGTWEQATSANADRGFVVERIAARRRTYPDFRFRIARRTTTVLVESELDNDGAGEGQ